MRELIKTGMTCLLCGAFLAGFGAAQGGWVRWLAIAFWFYVVFMHAGLVVALDDRSPKLPPNPCPSDWFPGFNPLKPMPKARPPRSAGRKKGAAEG